MAKQPDPYGLVTYTYECSEHGKFERLVQRAVADSQGCMGCGKVMKRLFDLPQVMKFEPYVDDVMAPTDVMITSRRQRNALLKERGLENVDKGHGWLTAGGIPKVASSFQKSEAKMQRQQKTIEQKKEAGVWRG